MEKMALKIRERGKRRKQKKRRNREKGKKEGQMKCKK